MLASVLARVRVRSAGRSSALDSHTHTHGLRSYLMRAEGLRSRAQACPRPRRRARLAERHLQRRPRQRPLQPPLAALACFVAVLRSPRGSSQRLGAAAADTGQKVCSRAAKVRPLRRPSPSPACLLLLLLRLQLQLAAKLGQVASCATCFCLQSQDATGKLRSQEQRDHFLP